MQCKHTCAGSCNDCVHEWKIDPNSWENAVGVITEKHTCVTCCRVKFEQVAKPQHKVKKK